MPAQQRGAHRRGDREEGTIRQEGATEHCFQTALLQTQPNNDRMHTHAHPRTSKTPPTTTPTTNTHTHTHTYTKRRGRCYWRDTQTHNSPARLSHTHTHTRAHRRASRLFCRASRRLAASPAAPPPPAPAFAPPNPNVTARVGGVGDGGASSPTPSRPSQSHPSPLPPPLPLGLEGLAFFRLRIEEDFELVPPFAEPVAGWISLASWYGVSAGRRQRARPASMRKRFFQQRRHCPNLRGLN